MATVYFFHGSHSSPKSTKIQHLKQIALAHDWHVNIPDHSAIRDPDARVADMLENDSFADEKIILVGSSMGGYVATVLSEHVRPAGLFLLAPAFYLANYQQQDPKPYADKIAIIQGWNDDVVPVANSIRFAQDYKTSLHILDGSHNLRENIPTIAELFTNFLQNT